MAESIFSTSDGLALAALVAGGEVSPTELLDEAIERTETVHDELNVLAHRDYEYARAQIDRGLPDGPFRGVPFLRKDEAVLFEGLATTSGSRLLTDFRADHNSTLAERYLAAGLVVFGATTVPPFSVTIDTDRSYYGPCLNPWDPSRTPGGSSAGSAVAVATGAIPMAHGSDGGGSLRIPAAWSGAFTVKPSRGRLPSGPIYTEGWMGFAAEGTITRSVRDCAAMMDATRGDETGRRYSCPQPARPYLAETSNDCRPLRIAVMTSTHDGASYDPQYQAALTTTADLLVQLGHEVEEAVPAIPIEKLMGQLYKTVAVDVANALDFIGEERGSPVRDDEIETLLATLRRGGTTISGQEYSAINTISMECAYAYDRFLADYDLVLSPTMPEPPPAIGEVYRHEADFDELSHGLDRLLSLTPVANVTGQPAMSVPLWHGEDNLPIGMMFTSRYGDESTLFALAAQLERAKPWWDRLPVLS